MRSLLGVSSLPSCCHPDAQHIRKGINTWLAEHWPFPPRGDQNQRLNKHDLGGLAVWCVPAGDSDRLIWAGRECGLILLADDYIDNDKDMGRIPAMKLATEGIHVNDDAASHAVAIAWRTVGQMSSLRQFAWNVKLTKAWFDTHYDTPASTLEEYVIARRANIGVHMFLNWVKWAVHIDLSDEVLEHPLFCLAEDLVADHSGIVNDYHSYEKEKLYESDAVSIVRILMDFEELDIVGARRRVIDLITSKEADFVSACSRILAEPFLGANDDVRKWLYHLQYIMGGNISWSEENGRYNLTGTIAYPSLLYRVDRVPKACFIPIPEEPGPLARQVHAFA